MDENIKSREHFSSRFREYLWLAALLLLAAATRLYGLSDFYFSPDEATYIGIAQAPTLAKVWEYAHFQNPPLIYILLHYWLMFCDNPRSLSLLIGMIVIVQYYCIGKRFGGTLHSMCMAALVAASSGCIIQSSVIRQYILLLFCVTGCFYYYLRWKQTPETRFLVYYTLCGALVDLSHYSAPFFFLCLGSYEFFSLIRQRAAFKQVASWCIANGLALTVFAAVYRSWLPIVTALGNYFYQYNLPPGTLPLFTLGYPFAVSGYIFTNTLIGGALLVAGVIITYKKPAFVAGNAPLRTSILLAGYALAFGMLLYVTRIYPPLGTRRNIWLMPLLIPAGSWLVVSGLRTYIYPLSPKFYFPICAMVLLLSSVIFYDSAIRFRDGSEYAISTKINNDVRSYLGTLAERDLIITEGDDAVWLADVYPYLSHDTTLHAVKAPYAQSEMLFDPYFPRFYNRDVMIAMLQQAADKGMLAGKDRLVFYRMAWSRSPLSDLLLCDALDKKITFFPPRETAGPLTRLDILKATAVAMEVDARSFMPAILTKDSRIRACLDGRHDSTTVRGPSDAPGYLAP